MKKINLFFCLALSVSLFFSCGNKKDADTIVNEMNSKRGDKDYLSSINSLMQTWIMSAEGTTFKYITFFERPNKLLITVSGMDGTVFIKTVYSNGSGYEELMGNRRELTSEELTDYEIRCKRWIDGYYNYKEDGDTFKFLRNEKIDDKKYYVLELTDKSGHQKEMYINQETGLEEMSEETLFDGMSKSMRFNRVEFSEFKDFDGLTTASKMTTITPEDKITMLTMESSINNVPFEPDFFR